jgi:ABC-2 type transport system ATP-binding protein
MAEVEAMAAGAARVRSPDDVRLASVLTQAGFDVRSLGDHTLAASAALEQIGELAAAHGIVLHELTAERATLEEVFLSLTGSDESEAEPA